MFKWRMRWGQKHVNSTILKNQKPCWRPCQSCQFLNGLPFLENTVLFIFTLGFKTINRESQSDVVVKRSSVGVIVLERSRGSPLMRVWEEGCWDHLITVPYTSTYHAKAKTSLNGFGCARQDIISCMGGLNECMAEFGLWEKKNGNPLSLKYWIC